MANSRMTFCKVCGFKRMPPHIQTVLSASSEPLDKRLSSPISVQPTMDSRQADQQLSLQVAELTREHNSSRHQRYSSDRRRSHSRSRSVNRGSGICYYHRCYKEQARKCVSPCAFVQKRVSSVIAGMAEPSKHTSRLFLLDRKSGQKFLIDSGSEICVIPPSPTMNKSPQSNFSLFAANNTKIPAYGIIRPSRSPWSSPLHVVPPNLTLQRFLPKAAEQQYLLSEFLKVLKGKKDSKPFKLKSSEAITAFQRCKQALADAALLAHRYLLPPLLFMWTPLDYAIGALRSCGL
ncbi:uncharacterized protein TNCV_862301 [Trichonephila clavipes]|nr:uncharacterized protein TNCV_862301 [Trichonephila clavipes]